MPSLKMPKLCAVKIHSNSLYGCLNYMFMVCRIKHLTTFYYGCIDHRMFVIIRIGGNPTR